MALATCLVLLGAVLMFSLALANIVTQSEKSARAERDRHLALQTAEAALLDAEREIRSSTDAKRKLFFANPGGSGHQGCGAADSPLRGLCLSLPGQQAFLETDLASDAVNRVVVPYGHYTKRQLPPNFSSVPVRLPQYLIEAVPHRTTGRAADDEAQPWLFRITAVGFGSTTGVQVVLQTTFRKEPT